MQQPRPSGPRSARSAGTVPASSASDRHSAKLRRSVCATVAASPQRAPAARDASVAWMAASVAPNCREFVARDGCRGHQRVEFGGAIELAHAHGSLDRRRRRP